MRNGLITLVALTAALAPAGAAHAATARVDDRTFVYEAAPGEANDLTVTTAQVGLGLWRIDATDGGAAIQPGTGCVPAPAGVTCVVTGSVPNLGGAPAKLSVHLGDGADQADLADVPALVRAGPGDDTIETGDLPDQIDPGTGDDVIDAGADLGQASDHVFYDSRTGPVAADGTAGTAGESGENDTLIGVENIHGGFGDDVMAGDANFYGGPGNDTLAGGTLRSLIFGGDGDDLLTAATSGSDIQGDAGADVLTGGPGRDGLNGGAGDDQLDGGPGADLIDCGPGLDTNVPDPLDVFVQGCESAGPIA